MIDDWLNFNCHVNYAFEKAAMAITAKAIMLNNSENSSKKGSKKDRNENKEKSRSALHRLMAMGVTSTYRTISSDAVYLIDSGRGQ